MIDCTAVGTTRTPLFVYEDPRTWQVMPSFRILRSIISELKIVRHNATDQPKQTNKSSVLTSSSSFVTFTVPRSCLFVTVVSRMSFAVRYLS